MVKEAAGGSGLFVGAPYAGLGLANFGKVAKNRKPHNACVQVYYFNSSTDLPKGDISSQCEATSAPCPARQPQSQIVEQHMFFLLNLVPQRWASAELTLHEEGSMFGSAIASSQSDKGEVSEARF